LPDVSGLTAMSSAASAAVNKQLMSLLFDRFSILEHLRALKLFLLLGQVELGVLKVYTVHTSWFRLIMFVSCQGDFVTSLLDLISPELDKPASQLSMPTLTGCLEGALRSSSVQFSSKDITDRLQVTLAAPRSSTSRKSGKSGSPGV
jgi:gamma-tubulin complex component 3